MESLEGTLNEDNKEKLEDKPLAKKDLQLCMTGAQKHMVEKDLSKFFMKHLNTEDIPLKGILKKRGNNFAFL